jgi:hypothetical protein
MIDTLLREAEDQYRRGQQYYQAQAAERAVVAFHSGLESLLRWSMIRDGAQPAVAMNKDEVTWQELVMYLDTRYAIERPACQFLAQMTHLNDQILAGGHPPLNSLTMQGYAQLVQQLFRRLYPRDAEERRQVAERGTFGRPQPVDSLTAMPPERAYDTPIMVPIPPPPPAPTTMAAVAAPPASRPAWAEQLLRLPPNARESEAPPLESTPPPGAFASEPQAFAAPAPPPSPAFAPAPPMSDPNMGDPDYDLGRAFEGMDLDDASQAASATDRAREAGARLRQMRIDGLEYCPRCRNGVSMISPTCPHCAFNLEAYRAAHRTAGRGDDSGLLGKLFSRRGRS